MKFSEFAKKLYNDNSLTKMNIHLIYHNNEIYCAIHEIRFTEIDIESDTIDAQLIRCNIWKSHEVGILWTTINKYKIILAKINPKESRDITIGYISNNDIFITDEPLIIRILHV